MRQTGWRVTVHVHDLYGFRTLIEAATVGPNKRVEVERDLFTHFTSPTSLEKPPPRTPAFRSTMHPVRSFDETSIERFTFDGQGNRRPWWSTDGTYLTYTHSPRSREWELLTKRADGTGDATVVLPFGVNTASYSTDGRWLVYSRDMASGDSDLFARRVGNDSDDLPLVATDARERNPTLSPDDRWLAYTSNESGQFEVYVRSFPDATTVRRQVSTSGGTEVRWSRDGRELFYRDGSGQMVAVEVVSDPTFSVGTQTVLFSAAGFLSNVPHPSYDVSSDGSRFVMIRQAVPLRPSELILVQNFVDELDASGPR